MRCVGEALVITKTIEIGAEYSHLVLGEGSGLVGAYHGCRTHGLTGVELAHKVMGFEHTPHAVGKAQCDSHRQSFRHRDHHQCNCNHYGLKQVGGEFHPIELWVRQEIHQYPSGHYCYPNHITESGDEFSQPVELFGQRGFHVVVDLRGFENLAVLGVVAYSGYAGNAVPLHHLGAAHHMVCRECSFWVELRRVG